MPAHLPRLEVVVESDENSMLEGQLASDPQARSERQDGCGTVLLAVTQDRDALEP